MAYYTERAVYDGYYEGGLGDFRIDVLLECVEHVYRS